MNATSLFCAAASSWIKALRYYAEMKKKRTCNHVKLVKQGGKVDFAVHVLGR